MEFSRDLARVTHTFEFITAVAYLHDQYPHHKTDTLKDLLNGDYYGDKRCGQFITHMDVALALCIINDTVPCWDEGRLFYAAYRGIPHPRSDYTSLNSPNFKTIRWLGEQLAKEVNRYQNAVVSVNSVLRKIDSNVSYLGTNRTVAYWNDRRDQNCTFIINTLRNILVQGRHLKRYWESLFWFLPKDNENYNLPLTFKRVTVDGVPNAVKVYVRSKRHKLCLCTRNSYLILGV